MDLGALESFLVSLETSNGASVASTRSSDLCATSGSMQFGRIKNGDGQVLKARWESDFWWCRMPSASSRARAMDFGFSHRPNNGKPESKCEQGRGFSRHQLGYGRIGGRIGAGVARRCEGRNIVGPRDGTLTHTLSSLSRPALCALRSLHWCGTVGGIKLPIGLSGWSSRLGISGFNRGCMFHHADTSMWTCGIFLEKHEKKPIHAKGTPSRQ